MKFYKRAKFFFMNKKPRVVKGKYDISYYINPNSAHDYHIVKHGITQDWIVTNIGKFVRKDGIIFDIGANAGLLSLPFAKKHVYEGIVFAFEPDLEVYEQLKKNIELNSIKNLIPFSKALQDDPTKEIAIFYKRRIIDGDYLVNLGLSTMEKMPIHNIDEDSVPCSTIDKEVLHNQVSKVDFIKIDVEGSEYKVLKGGFETINNYQPIIHYEYSTIIDKLANSENTFQSYQFLSELGYKQFNIFAEKTLIELKEYDPELDQTNVIAFHKSALPSKLC